MAAADNHISCNSARGTSQMVISTEGSMELNLRITNKNAIDMPVGNRVRLWRTLLGMSQELLGIKLNITYSQVQK